MEAVERRGLPFYRNKFLTEKYGPQAFAGARVVNCRHMCAARTTSCLMGYNSPGAALCERRRASAQVGPSLTAICHRANKSRRLASYATDAERKKTVSNCGGSRGSAATEAGYMRAEAQYCRCGSKIGTARYTTEQGGSKWCSQKRSSVRALV